MSRKRLTRQSNRNPRRQRTADPYSMNQDRMNPPVEDYMNGDPSAWAEDPVDDLGFIEDEDRNEIGMGEMMPTTYNHKDSEEPNDGQSYDNMSGRNAHMRMAQLQKQMERKALQCLRIASLLLPNASEDMIAEQALDLMPLPIDSVVATSLRLAEAETYARYAAEEEEDEEKKDAGKKHSEEDEMDEKDAGKKHSEEEEEMEEKDSKKASSLSADEMLRRMLASKDEDEDEEKDASDDEDEEKDASDDEDEDEESKEASLAKNILSQVASMLRAAGLQVNAADEDDEEEKDASDDEDEDEGEGKEASAYDLLRELENFDSVDAGYDLEAGHMDNMMAGDDEFMYGNQDLDAMLADVQDETMDGMMDIDMTPTMDSFEDDAMLAGTDEELEAMMMMPQSSVAARNLRAKQARQQKQQHIQSLGRVKEASAQTGGDPLSQLWPSAPDVSDVFRSGNY